MGKAGSKLRFWTRPIKYYNIEQRAMKEISKEKQKQAPNYPSMEKIMQQIKSDPSLLNKGKPSKEELEKLGQVYLTSTGNNPTIRPIEETVSTINPSIPPSASTSKLPKNTDDVKDPYYGYEEPYIIPKGKLSLRQALDLISKHQQDKEKWSPEVLSEEFKIDLNTTINIVEHFRTFQIYVPEKLTKDQNLTQLEKVKSFVVKQFVPNDRPKPKQPPPLAPPDKQPKRDKLPKS